MAVVKRTFLQQLTNASESGQPIPVIRLVGGEVLRNLVVRNVGIDYVELGDLDTEGTMYVPFNQLLSIGTM